MPANPPPKPKSHHKRLDALSVAACQHTSAIPQNPSSMAYGLASYAYQYAKVTRGNNILMKPPKALDRTETNRYKHKQNTQKPTISGSLTLKEVSPRTRSDSLVKRYSAGGLKS